MQDGADCHVPADVVMRTQETAGNGEGTQTEAGGNNDVGPEGIEAWQPIAAQNSVAGVEAI